ncbi:V-type ATP synthase subunit I, partial [bacterium]|nr:V-type ATP synthase subunit I [bacterium]
LTEIENRFYHTVSTVLIEGWIRALDRKNLEKSLSSNFDDIEFAFREPLDDEEPPIHLDNNAVVRPSEFVTTLYGRPIYSEVDPTPLLAPFFILFFAMCLSDAGYGITLAAFAGVIILKFKPSGGFALLMKLLFAGGIVTAVVGVLSGGIFGIGEESFPPFMRQFILVNPLKEPMKMLNISFVMGLVHMLFGMGIKMRAKIKEGMIADAMFDNFCWIIFLIALAPLGYSIILGGYMPDVVMWWSKKIALIFVFIIFVTGGRKKKSFIKKILGGLVGFYDVVGYFGDVLSYARLLALGLATSAIAIAVNDIARMVIGMPFYVGYLAAALILLGGHTFNLAVNTLGGFVHSARLQYLEFFSKFFTGGGKGFQPFRNERQHSIIKKQDTD